jgi:hypothetical protein
MGRAINTNSLTGYRSHRLVVQDEFERKEFGNKMRTFWKCLCDCGNIYWAESYNIKTKIAKSCGCINKSGQSNTKHGMANSKLYRVWYSMKQRCINPKVPAYKWYGRRGIHVCESWDTDFLSFVYWSLSNGYEEGLTLDRINNDGNYEPSNCRWVTFKVQSNNRSTNKFIEYNNKRLTYKQWSQELGVRYEILKDKSNNGKTLDTIIKEEEKFKKYKQSVLESDDINNHDTFQVSIRYRDSFATYREYYGYIQRQIKIWNKKVISKK